MASGDREDTEDFTYDSAVYYEEDDSKKADILEIRARLEDDRWGLTICDPYRDGDGTQMGRFEHSAKNSRHAIIFLSPSLLERMKNRQESHSQFSIETFLCNILDRHDTTLERRVIPVWFESEGAEKPFILSRYTPLCPGEVGFWRKLYRSLSRLPVPGAFMTQVSQRVRNVKNLQQEAVLHIAAKLGLPEEVVDGIKVEYGGSQAMLREVFYCWKSHLGPEATIDAVDDIISEVITMPQQVEQQQQSLGTVDFEILKVFLKFVLFAVSKDADSGVVDGRSNSTDDEALSDGLRSLNLNTQQSGDPDMGAKEKTKVHEGEEHDGKDAKNLILAVNS
uniref:TIR domain-containing protein n=1 Tax=Branchiostoma floridae TaxID=7739 RepID=C3YQE9_BRAFL|eukprot:XP_002601467.1 hypothetical protein BRAFLDRAFT_104411 [Branchiostoma floridae]